MPFWFSHWDFLVPLYIIASDFAQKIVFAVIFVTLLTFGLFFTAELYKSTVRAMVFKWVSLQIRNSKEKRVNMLESKIIIGCNKKKVRFNRGSAMFAWLNNIFLRPLEQQGFSVDIVEEENSDGKKYVKAILIGQRTL